MKPKNYSIQEVFNSTSIGLVFEFYSSKDSAFIIEDLSRASSKNVTITGDRKIHPTWSNAILLKEFNGKRPRYQFKIAPQDYLSIGESIHSILEWINNEAVLDYSTKLQVELLFKNYHLRTINSISDVDKGKLILNLDEEFLYSRFPEMKRSPFCLSVKNVKPYNGFLNNSINLSTLSHTMNFQISENYGIDLSGQPMGILKFNYIGGSDYAARPNDVYETIRYYISSTYQVINSNEFTKDMEYGLNKMVENYRKLRRCYFEPEYFLKEYKDIKVSADLNKNIQMVKTFWPQMRDKLINLVLESNLNKGYFNYNSDDSSFELKDANIFGLIESNMNFVNCEISGIISNSSLWRSKVKNSKMIDSKLIVNNKVISSLMESCVAEPSNDIEKSYIINKGETINCRVKESIIIDANIGRNAKLDEECTLIELRQTPSPDMNKGINIKEPRDYRWIKDMRSSSSDKGFQNEYKIKY